MNADKMSVATMRPISCMTMNIGTDSRAIPAKDSLKLRAIDTAGFANDAHFSEDNTVSPKLIPF